MKYSKRIKTTMCLAATITAFLTVDFNIVDAFSISKEKGIAGIAVSLDKFYNADKDNTLASVNTNNEVNALSTLDINTTNIVEEVAPLADNMIKQEVKKVVETKVEEPKQEEKNEEVKVSEYENTGISIADGYVNIRKEANTDSKVLGKLYKGSAAKILKKQDEWVKIKSGDVTGYINSEFLAIGFNAEELVDKYATKLATVNTTTLKVRKAKSIDSECITMIPEGEVYETVKEYDGWVKISIDDSEEDSIKGYVSKEFVEITTEFKEAVSIKEEQEQLAREEAARKAEMEQLQRLQRQATSSNSSSNSNKNVNNSNKTSNTGKSATIADDPKDSGSGSEIAGYALKFVGNPYVYGGTSLTNGTDCSGFVQSVYRSYGYSIPRDSRSQAAGAGKKVDLGSLRSGDLVFYTGGSGSVNHVALYIGGGQVVHASSPRTGIKVSKVNYRSPYMARRVIN